MEVKSPSGKNYVNLIVAVTLAIAWAIFWTVDRTLAYLLFGAASFFLVYYIYNKFQQRDTGEPYKRSRDTVFRKREQTTELPAVSGKILARIIAVLVIGSVVVYMFYEIAKGNANEMDETAAYYKGESFYALGQYDSAYYFYKRALQTNTDMAEAWLGLGNTLYMQSKTDSALLMYNEALRADEDYIQARYNIAWWYYDQRQYEESVARAKALVVEEPSYTEAMQLTGDNFYALSEYDSALRWYEGAYANGARSRWLCHVMAYLYDRDDVLDKAIPLYVEALEYDSTLVDIYIRLGELLPGEAGNAYRNKAATLKNQ